MNRLLSRLKENPQYGVIVLRVGLALVLVWFGTSQLYNPLDWTGFVPDMITQFIAAKMVVMLNGVVEILCSLLLFCGLGLRPVSFVMGLHLFGIAFSMVFTPALMAIAVRDFGLAFAFIALCLLGPDRWTLDMFFARKMESSK